MTYGSCTRSSNRRARSVPSRCALRPRTTRNPRWRESMAHQPSANSRRPSLPCRLAPLHEPRRRLKLGPSSSRYLFSSSSPKATPSSVGPSTKSRRPSRPCRRLTLGLERREFPLLVVIVQVVAKAWRVSQAQIKTSTLFFHELCQGSSSVIGVLLERPAHQQTEVW
jgi:hypothetical protein